MSVAGGEKRRAYRVAFESSFRAKIMGIDGTWQRSCKVNNVSETGAGLSITDSVEGLNLSEFFLVLSSTGLTYRRCELAWVNGEHLGVRFLKVDHRKRKPNRPNNAP